MRVGIVGGGIAGLTAAYELGKQGHHVTVFERDPELGGQAGSFVLNGERLERFYHHIFTNDQHVVDLIEELGLNDQMEWLSSRMGIFYDGQVHRFGGPIDLLQFSPLSFPDRIRFGLLVLYLQRYKDWRRMESRTAFEWVQRNGGQSIHEVVWGPLLRGKFGDRAQNVSMTWLWGKIHLRGKSRSQGMQKELLGYMNGSFQKLIDGLERAVVGQGGLIHKATTVRRVIVDRGRAVGLEAVPTPGQGPQDSAPEASQPLDAVIATVPSPVFLGMAPEMPEDYARKLRAIEYQSAVVAVLELDRKLTDIYWMNISDRRLPFVGAIEHTNFISPARYGDSHVLYLSNYLAKSNDLYGLSNDDLVATYMAQLPKLNPTFESSWVKGYRVFRDDAGQPIVTTGYSQLIPDHVTPITGLYLANTTQIYPEDRGMNYSVRLGRDIAALVHQRNSEA